MNKWWLPLMHHVTPQWMRLALLAMLVLIGATIAALIPWPMKLIVDYVLTGEPLPSQLEWLPKLPAANAASSDITKHLGVQI